MSIVKKIRHSSTNGLGARGYRQLTRALSTAPTRASREELLNFSNMGR